MAKVSKSVLCFKKKKITRVVLPVENIRNVKSFRRGLFKNPWLLHNFLYSEKIAFHHTEKKLMRIGFKLWFLEIEKAFAKRDYVELLIFIRKEKTK